MGHRSPALFPVPRSRLRAGRQLQLRRAGRPLQLGTRQRPRQSRQPHADHDQAVSRRHHSRVRIATGSSACADRARSGHRCRPTRSFRCVRILQGSRSHLVDALRRRQIHRRASSLEAREIHRRRRSGRSSTTLSTPPPKHCASRSRCCIRCCPNRRRTSGHNSAWPSPLEDLELAKLDLGPVDAGQTIGMIAPVFPRIEAKSAIDRMRALEEEETARQAKLLGKPVALRKPEAGSPEAHLDRPRQRSTSTISSKSICASARCSPPSASKARTNSCT